LYKDTYIPFSRQGKNIFNPHGRKEVKQYEYLEAEDYYDMGIAWLDQDNLERAEDCLRHAIECNPAYSYAYIDLARVLARRADFHGAVHVLKEASFHDRNFDRIYYLMAKYAFKEGDFRNALHHIERALEVEQKELYIRVRKIIERKYRGARP